MTIYLVRTKDSRGEQLAPLIMEATDIRILRHKIMYYLRIHQCVLASIKDLDTGEVFNKIRVSRNGRVELIHGRDIEPEQSTETVEDWEGSEPDTRDTEG